MPCLKGNFNTRFCEGVEKDIWDFSKSTGCTVFLCLHSCESVLIGLVWSLMFFDLTPSLVLRLKGGRRDYRGQNIYSDFPTTIGSYSLATKDEYE